MRAWIHDSRSAARWLQALALAACVYFAIHGVRAALKSGGSDFTIYHEAGRAVLEGRDPNAVFGFIYLPFFALCMAPLALLPYPAAVILWQAASFAALVWIARTCVDLVRADGLRTPVWLAWAPLVCVLRLVDSNFGNGQVNLLVFAVVLAGARAWVAGRHIAAGSWIGFATALKLVPGFLVIVFGARRAWKACAAAAFATLALVFVVPAACTGHGANLAQLGTWWSQTSRPYVAGGNELIESREYLPGQSLTPVLYRLLTATPATSRKSAGPTVNVLDLDLETAKWVVRGAQVLLLLVVVLATLRARANGGPGARLVELSIAIAGVLALAPLVHKAHLVWLILPYAVVLSGAPEGISRRARIARWSLIALSVALIGLTTPALFGPQVASTFLSHNAIFFGLASVLAALLVDVFGVGGTVRGSGAG